MYEFRRVMDHVEVYVDGEFLLSADNEAEADGELEEVS